MPVPTTTLLVLLFLLSTGHGKAATQHVRGGEAAAEGFEDEETRRNNLDIGQALGFRTYRNSSDNQQQQQQQREQQQQEPQPQPQQRQLPHVNRLVSHGFATKPEEEYASCPEGYPAFGKLGDLLTAWSPNQAEVPDDGVIERLRVSNHLVQRYCCIQTHCFIIDKENARLEYTSNVPAGKQYWYSVLQQYL